MTNPRDYDLPDPSLDPEAQRIAWERDRDERGWRHTLGSAYEEGFRIGKKEGGLLWLLTEKFGPLAEEHRSRLAGADEATLDRWLDGIVDAATIDDLFRE